MQGVRYQGREWDDDADDAHEESWGPIDKMRGAVLWGTDWTAETLIAQLKKDNIKLSPKFQRRDAWSIERKSKFIESIILGFPIPAIILAESKKGDGKFIVLDGKQRLLSMRQFSATASDTEFEQIRLTGLEVLEDLNGRSYQDLNQLTFTADYRNLFDNSPIRTVIVRSWPNEAYLHSVFLRLNTGSLPLSPQELRQALHPGAFIDYVEAVSRSGQILAALQLSSPDSRMRDVEVTLRYYAFKNFLSEYDGKLRDFLDETCDRLNKLWIKKSADIERQGEDLKTAIGACFVIFGKDRAFSKWTGSKYSKSFNRPLFDIMTCYFSDPEIRIPAIEKKNAVEAAFKSLCENDAEFLQSLELGTNHVSSTTVRFQRWGRALSEILGRDVTLELPKMKFRRIPKSKL